MKKTRIYLDNCCYNRPYDNQNDTAIFKETQAKMFVQSLIRYNTVDLVYSSVSVKEVMDTPFEEKRKSILEFIENNAKYYLGNDKNDDLIKLTEDVMKTGIKLKDASHTACAIMSECDYMISTDKRLLKYKDNRIKIVNPIEFVEMWRKTI